LLLKDPQLIEKVIETCTYRPEFIAMDLFDLNKVIINLNDLPKFHNTPIQILFIHRSKTYS